LRSTARRSMRTDDFHQDAQQLNNTLIESLEGTADAREAFLPGGFGKKWFLGDRPPAGALYGAQEEALAFTATHGQVRSSKRGGLGALFGPQRARVALQAASDPEKEHVRNEKLARAEAIRKAYYERNPEKAPEEEKEDPVRNETLARAKAIRKAPKEEKEDPVRNPENAPKEDLESKPQEQVHEKEQVVVSSLDRYAVKGLERDELSHVDLTSGSAFPYDRAYALIFERNPGPDAGLYDPLAPSWLHKSNFLCAFTSNELMGSFDTAFDDSTQTLTVSRRGGATLLCECLEEADGRARVEAFFSDACGRAVRVVSGGGEGGDDCGAGRNHQFGNTASGVRVGDGSTRTIHLINANTVAAFATAIGQSVHPDRFRANIVLSGGLPAWEEFSWVGRDIQVGTATLRVIKRTVRCAGINVDARHASGREDLDVPALLARHFPEHGPFFGVYAQVVGGGSISVGDNVTLHERGKTS